MNDPEGYEDPERAEFRRLERLKRREIEAVEKLAASQDRTKEFLSFPKIGATLLPAVTAANPSLSPEAIAFRVCDIVESFAREAARRWSNSEIASE